MKTFTTPAYSITAKKNFDSYDVMKVVLYNKNQNISNQTIISTLKLTLTPSTRWKKMHNIFGLKRYKSWTLDLEYIIEVICYQLVLDWRKISLCSECKRSWVVRAGYITAKDVLLGTYSLTASTTPAYSISGKKIQFFWCDESCPTYWESGHVKTNHFLFPKYDIWTWIGL